MKPAEMRAMDDSTLNHQMGELQAEWRNLRFQEAVGKLTATARICQIRKDIARIKTIQSERLIEAEYAVLRQDGLGYHLRERSEKAMSDETTQAPPAPPAQTPRTQKV